MVNPAGAVVTIDALGCQKDIACPTLHADVQWLFEHAECIGWDKVEHSYSKTCNKGHGRLETRECWVLANLEALAQSGEWRGLTTVVRVRGERLIGDKESVEDRFFIPVMPSGCCGRYASTGGLRTACTGCWIWPLMRMLLGHGRNTYRRTW